MADLVSTGLQLIGLPPITWLSLPVPTLPGA